MPGPFSPLPIVSEFEEGGIRALDAVASRGSSLRSSQFDSQPSVHGAVAGQPSRAYMADSSNIQETDVDDDEFNNGSRHLGWAASSRTSWDDQNV